MKSEAKKAHADSSYGPVGELRDDSSVVHLVWCAFADSHIVLGKSQVGGFKVTLKVADRSERDDVDKDYKDEYIIGEKRYPTGTGNSLVLVTDAMTERSPTPIAHARLIKILHCKSPMLTSDRPRRRRIAGAGNVPVPLGINHSRGGGTRANPK